MRTHSFPMFDTQAINAEILSDIEDGLISPEQVRFSQPAIETFDEIEDQLFTDYVQSMEAAWAEYDAMDFN